MHTAVWKLDRLQSIIYPSYRSAESQQYSETAIRRDMAYQQPAPAQPQATTPAPLPEEWKEAKHPDGRTYYYDTYTKKTRWDRPDTKYSETDIKNACKELGISDASIDSLMHKLKALPNPERAPPELPPQRDWPPLTLSRGLYTQEWTETIPYGLPEYGESYKEYNVLVGKCDGTTITITHETTKVGFERLSTDPNAKDDRVTNRYVITYDKIKVGENTKTLHGLYQLGKTRLRLVLLKYTNESAADSLLEQMHAMKFHGVAPSVITLSAA